MALALVLADVTCAFSVSATIYVGQIASTLCRSKNIIRICGFIRLNDKNYPIAIISIPIEDKVIDNFDVAWVWKLGVSKMA